MFKKTKSKLAVLISVILCVSMISGMSTSVFATDHSATLPKADAQVSMEDIQLNTIDDDGSFEVQDINTIPEILAEDKKGIEVNTKARGTWRITDNVYVGDGQLTPSNTMDMYILSTTTATTPVLKIGSGDSNVIAQLFTYNPSTGAAAPTNFMDQAGDSTATIAGSLAAGNYLLAVGSIDNTSTAAYTLMWNCANPANPQQVIYASPNLDLVTLSYGYQAIRSNGVDIVEPSKLKWEEHFTLTVNNSYVGRDQEVSSVKIRKIHLGSFSTNKYSTDNALFVEVGENTLWSIMRSSYSNDGGEVTHEMDQYDVTGQKTPRRLNSNDMVTGPHFIVIDLNENMIVDFASPYNHLWQTGDITGSATLTQKDI